MGFADYLIQHQMAFLLIFVRVSAFIMVLPMMGGKTVPLAVKAFFIMAISFVLVPIIQVADLELSLSTLSLGALEEILIGILIGIGTRFLFAAVEIGAEVMGVQMGFGLAHIFDPTAGQQVSLVGRLHGMLAILIFFLVDGHHLILRTLIRSFEWVPFLGFKMNGMIIQDFIQLGAQMFVLGIQLAIPVMVSLLLVNVTIGILGRVVPQMNVLLFGFPITIGVGFLMMGASVPIFLGIVGNEVRGLEELYSRFLIGMGQ